MAKKKFSETVLGKILAGKGIKKDKAKATSSSSEGSFKSAFAAARKAQGAGGTFTWKGNKYNTNLASEVKAKVIRMQIENNSKKGKKQSPQWYKPSS
jgi:hypothetical protein